MAVTALAFRIVRVWQIPSAQLSLLFNTVADPTQNRMDSLFFGVLLGYFYHFKPHYLKRLESNWCAIVLSILAAALISCCFFVPLPSRLMLTAGFTLVYGGSVSSSCSV